MSRGRIAVIALLFFLSCAVYINTLGNSFLWDDDDLIVKNQCIRSFTYLPVLFAPSFWRQFEISMNQGIGDKGADYRPLSMVTFVWDYFMWRLKPAGYHVTNMLLHALNVLLIYLFILKLGLRERLAVFAALFFAVHPVHTESVTWIKNRSDIIAAMFVLWSFYLYVRHHEEKEAQPRLKYYAGSLICMMAGLLSKETAIVLPLLLVIYIALFVSREARRSAMTGILSFMGLAILYIAFKFSVFSAGNESAHASCGLMERLLTVIKTFGIYINMLTLPVNLNAARAFQIPHSLADPIALSSLITMILLLVIVFQIRERKALTFGILWALIALVPVSNVIVLAARPIAEQRLYIPSIGFCMILAAALEEIRSKKTVILLGILMISVYSFATVTRNNDWKDSLTFWRTTVKASPENSIAHNNLGLAYADLIRFQDAIGEYKKAIALDSKSAIAYYNMGLAYRNLGKDGEAIDNFKKAIELRPGYSQAYNNIGVTIHADTKNADEAISYFRKAIEMNPDNAEAYNNLGALLFARDGDTERASLYCQKAIKLKPDYADAYYNLGLFLDNKGKTDDAVRYYRKAAELKEDYADAHINLGAAYRDIGNLDGSLRELTRALELEPKNALIHKNLALTYEQMGDMDKANDSWKRVIEINPEDRQAKSKVSLQLETILSPQ